MDLVFLLLFCYQILILSLVIISMYSVGFEKLAPLYFFSPLKQFCNYLTSSKQSGLVYLLSYCTSLGKILPSDHYLHFQHFRCPPPSHAPAPPSHLLAWPTVLPLPSKSTLSPYAPKFELNYRMSTLSFRT